VEGKDKAVNIGEWKTYSHKLAKYNDQSNQVFSLVLGQCTQVLKDKMKHGPQYTAIMDAHKPLELKKLISKIILAQSDDQFCCKTIHEQSCSLLSFQQGNLSTAEYYKKFNTRIDVAQTVGLNQVHPAAVDVMVKELLPTQEYVDLL
jgi:hypothetical protein